MSRRPGPVIVMCTVLLVHLAFSTVTYHVSEVKFFVFTAGVLVLLAVVSADVLFGRQKLAEAFAGGAPKHVLAAVLAYLVLSAASVIWAAYRPAALFRTLEILLYVSWAVLVAVTVRTRREVSRLITLFVWAGVLVAAVSFACYPFYAQHRQQFFLPMGTGNWLAACLLIPMVLCVEGFWRNVFGARRRAGSAALFAIAFAPMAAVLVFAESESAAVSLLVALAALPILLGAKRRRLIAALVLGVLALACVADLTLGQPGKIRSFARSKSVEIRLAMWRWSVKLAKRNPVSGLGAGGYFPSVQAVSAPEMSRRPGYFADINVHAHCEPLEVLVELGLLGLAAFLWPVVGLLRGVVRGPRDGPDDVLRLRLGAFAAGWLALFLQSFVTVGIRFWSVPVVFWTGVGLLFASLRILSVPEEAGEADVREAQPLSRRTVNVGLAVLVVLLAAGTYFLLYRGFRASVAMKETISPMGQARRIRLLETVSEESVFFVDRVRARSALGRLYDELGKPAQAGEQYETVLRLAGDYHDTQLLLARTYLARKRLDDAAPLIESYGNLRPADPRSADLLVGYLRALPPDEAVRTLDALIGKHPRSSKLHVVAGKIALEFDPPDEQAARRHFEEALKLNPDDAHAAYLLGMETLKRKDYAAARVLLSKSFDAGFRVPELYLNLSRVERMFGEEERSRGLLREGAGLFPDSTELRQELEKLTQPGG